MTILKKIFQYTETRFIKDITIFLMLIVVVYFSYLKFFNLAMDHLPFTIEEHIWKRVAKDINIINYHNSNIKNISNRVSMLPATILPKKYKKIGLYVVNNEYINAHAFIGGNIIITKKLLDHIQSEQVLMFVVLHEIGHLKYNDHLDEISKSLLNKVFMLFMPKEYYILQQFMPSLNYQKSLQKEYDADRFAFNILSKIYGNSSAAIEFFNIINIMTESPSNYLGSMSHPLINQRKEKLLVKFKQKYDVN